MSAQIHALTHGFRGLELGYAIVLVSMLVGLVHARASWSKFLLAALLTIPAIALAGLIISITSPLLRSLAINDDSVVQLLFGVAILVAVGYAAGRALAAHNQQSSSADHRRGAIVGSGHLQRSNPNKGRFWSWLQSPAEASGRPAGITLADVPVSLEDETKHFKLIGTTGTGKSTAIREILAAALARGDRAIIADPDGGYLSRFYDPDRGDVILNPFDGDAHKWDLFGEIINDYDIEQLARSLIPDSGDSERIWCEYARTFFVAVVRQSLKANERNDAELYRLITAGSDKELRTLLAGTAAGPFLEEGNEKMFGSLRSVASSAVKVLEYTTRQQATPFSIRRWVQQRGAQHTDGPSGVLFLPYTAGEIAALRSVISAWMRLGIFEAMERGEGDQRLWFVVDELDALGQIDGLKDALARLRKFGGRCVLGFQSIAQVSGTYGKGTAETITENCGNTLILRCSASEHGGTSEFASKLIGQREVLHTTHSKSRLSGAWRSTTTSSQQLRIEPAVMASEIERLPDLAGFLKLATLPDWQTVTLTPRSAPSVVRIRKPAVTSSPPAASPPPSPISAAANSPPPAPPLTNSQIPPPTVASRKGRPRGAKRTIQKRAGGGESQQPPP